jgi:acyl carrier protein
MNRLDRTQIEVALQDCLKHIARDTYPAEWKPSDSVIRCCGLDSQHGIELACDLESRLGIVIPVKENPLVLDDDGEGKKRARTFGEVVDYLTALAS